MRIKTQIDYWREGSKEDMQAAQVLLEKRKTRHALFFAHLALEKALKANVARATKDIPPRIHNLVRLADISGLSVPEGRSDFLRKFNLYQMEGRYPEQLGKIRVPLASARVLLTAAQEMRRWLIRQLSKS